MKVTRVELDCQRYQYTLYIRSSLSDELSTRKGARDDVDGIWKHSRINNSNTNHKEIPNQILTWIWSGFTIRIYWFARNDKKQTSLLSKNNCPVIPRANYLYFSVPDMMLLADVQNSVVGTVVDFFVAAIQTFAVTTQ